MGVSLIISHFARETEAQELNKHVFQVKRKGLSSECSKLSRAPQESLAVTSKDKNGGVRAGMDTGPVWEGLRSHAMGPYWALGHFTRLKCFDYYVDLLYRTWRGLSLPGPLSSSVKWTITAPTRQDWVNNRCQHSCGMCVCGKR